MSYRKIRRDIVKTFKTRPPKYAPLKLETTPYAPRILLPHDISAHGIMDFVMAMARFNPKGFRDARSGKHKDGRGKEADTLIARAAKIAFG